MITAERPAVARADATARKTRVHRAALALLSAGVPCLPIRTDGAPGKGGYKAPACREWAFLHTRLPTEAEIDDMFGGRDVGIAIAGGVAGNGLVCIDFDEPDPPRFFPAFMDLCAVVPDLAAIVSRAPLVRTPTGGVHLWVRTAGVPPKNQKLARTDDPHKGIELRGDGGYAICPPSPATCHDKYHEWAAEGRELPGWDFIRETADGRPRPLFPDIPTITADELDSLLGFCRSLTEKVDAADLYAHPVARERQPGDALPPGDDFSERGGPDALACLERHGWQPIGRAGGKVYLTRPGKNGGNSATFGNAGTNLFYPFTTSCDPFPLAGRPYTPFAVVAFLEHGGDFAAAAADLGRKGYGDQARRRPQRPAPPPVDRAGIAAAVADSRARSDAILAELAAKVAEEPPAILTPRAPSMAHQYALDLDGGEQCELTVGGRYVGIVRPSDDGAGWTYRASKYGEPTGPAFGTREDAADALYSAYCIRRSANHA